MFVLSMLMSFALIPIVYCSPFHSTSQVDTFLNSIDVDPKTIDSNTKRIGGVAFTCAVLNQTKSTEIVTRSSNSTLYLTEAEAHWSATAYKFPSCIYTPSDAKGVALGVKVTSFANCEFAVRSGGHSPLSDWANIDHQVLISLSGITDLYYDEVTETQRSGFGNRWEDVYKYLVPYERIVVGGRQGTVGMALSTGGGLSHLSNAHGWASQNVLSYEVVLANATIVTASLTENPDLFFALKSGGNNFGIVTHITQKTVPLGKVWGGVMEFSGNHSSEFMAAIAKYQTEGQLDTKSAILPYIGTNNDTILCTFAYLDDIDRPAAFQPFYDIPVVVDTTQILDSFYNLAAATLPSAVPRWTYGTTTILHDANTYVGVLDILSKYSTTTAKLSGGSFVLMAQPISKSMVENSAALGPDPLTVKPEAQMWFTINIGWSLASDDSTVHGILTEALSTVDKYTESRGVHDKFIFYNDAYSTQKPYDSYSAGTLGELKKTSKVYDPEGVFQRLVPGGFKLD